ncbi:hypothetical protein BDV10DRAFT_111731 [Aspergillus recurvatus]
MTTIQDQLTTQLQSKFLPVSPTWLATFLSTGTHQRTPLPALTKTALFRLLNTDFRECLTPRSPTYILPVDIFDPNVQERGLTGPIPLQVLDVEDIGTSIWSQIEAIERVERGEAVHGREIVRTVNVGDEQDGNGNRSRNAGPNTNANGSNGPHRLLLQDAKGTRAVGIEMAPIDGLGVGQLPIGGKLLLKDATVARGMILLTPESVTLLGGKIEAMDLAWRTGRKSRLLENITGTGTGTGRGDA